ncbi:MAG TPA: WD40 repeat domain-containing protein, partial [Pirellulaceae bacterium]|nr:WD40 repeat domain-containing protein [Pirellulaceae bacterium]
MLATGTLVNPNICRADDEGEPVLRLEAGGPTSYVTALAFSPDGQTLFAGSWDKTVRVWQLDRATRAFRQSDATWRVPIGPGLDGAINAIAVSPDGNWVAAAGKAVIAGAADFRQPGRVLPTIGGLSDAMRLDEGAIYAFHIRTRTTYTLRGHRGEVRALTFAPSTAEQPLLASAAREWNAETASYDGAVRLWDVTGKAPLLATQAMPEPALESWPKLAISRQAKSATALHVAIAWGDGSFRVWDVAGEQLREQPRQGQYNDTVVYHPSARQFIAGSLSGEGGLRLRAWSDPLAATPEIDAAHSIEFAKSGSAITAPRGLAMFSAKVAGTADALAAVIHRHFPSDANKDQYELWLTTPLRGAKIQPLHLWATGAVPRRLPVIATTPQGRHIAVSHNAEIQVFGIDALLAGKKEPQILRSVGATIRSLAFVRQGEAKDAPLGLALSERGLRELATDTLIQDFAAAKLSRYAADSGWQITPAPVGNWKVTEQGGEMKIVQGAQQRGTIKLEAGEAFTSYAICAASKPPIVAVAAHRSGLPSLRLYDAASGQLVRQLSAQTGLIRSLSFSDDGLLLASTAEDQTVALWRLADLGKIVGQHGLAAGVAVRTTDNGLTVTLDKSQANNDLLANGDLLLGSVAGDKLQPWKSPRDFYDAFWNALPGETIRIRRARADVPDSDVAVPVAQGADERKPLLSLFITQGDLKQPPAWIGWSPLGPYQSSNEDVEQYLGWHFNTGRPEAPVAFARAAQYREKYFRDGLLDTLIKTGIPPENVQATAPLPRPSMELVLDIGTMQPSGELLVREIPTRASLILNGISPEAVDKVELRQDGKVVAALQGQVDGTTWSTELDGKLWTPGTHQLQAIVSTREKSPQQFPLSRAVRYQVAAPTIELANRTGPGGIVDRAALSFMATVTPGAPGTATTVALYHLRGKGSTLIKEWDSEKPQEIQEPIELAPGGNILELVARNRAALADHEALETTRARLVVNYSDKAQLPSLVDLTLVPIERGQPLQPLAGESEPTIVAIDKIKLAGEISGVDSKLEIESSLGGAAAGVVVAPAQAGKPAKFSTSDLVLQPGVQTIVVRRQDGAGPAIATQTRIDYRPPLPQLTIIQPAGEVILVEGRDEPRIAIVGQLSAVSHRHPFKAEILVNGQPLAIMPTIDREQGKFTADVPVPAGDSNVAVRLSNAWSPPEDTLVASVRLLSLPTIEKISEIAPPTAPIIDVVVSGKSATPLASLEVTGPQLAKLRLPAEAIVFDKAHGTWQATLKSLPLLAEPRKLLVLATNQHGTSLSAGQIALPAWIKDEPLPTIELAAGGNVTSANYELQFTVRSKSPLRSVGLQQNQTALDYAPKLADIKPDAAGWYVLLAAVPLQLATGDNRLIVTVTNAGGSQVEQSLVNYIDPPARVVIDRFETVDLPNKITLPIVWQNNRARAANASPTAKVMVCGRVVWPRSIDKEYLRRLQRLQVWVNGFQQAP